MLTALLKLEARNLKLLVLFLCAFVAQSHALDRNAFTFTRYRLQVQIDPAQHGFAAQGIITLRNDSSAPRKHAVLQISSSLNWISITFGPQKTPLTYVTHPYTSDVDHTGALSEAVVSLPQPFPAGATVELNVAYSGQITLDTARLEGIGTPKEIAAQTDWDQIAPDFTAVRGVGYVCWYPVAMDSLSLDDGRDYSSALHAFGERSRQTFFSVTVNSAGSPGLIGASGENCADAPNESCRRYTLPQLGDIVPVLVLGEQRATLLPGSKLSLSNLAGADAASKQFTNAAARALLVTQDWFAPEKYGSHIYQLPDGDAAFPVGFDLLTPFDSDAQNMELTAARELAYSSLRSPRAWINDGLAGFAQALMREHQANRVAALAFLQQQLPTLVREEKENAEAAHAGAAQQLDAVASSLAGGNDDLLNNSKAIYIWWMLREMLGDNVLKSAIKNYADAQDKDPSYMQSLLQQAASAQHVTPRMPLQQFFDDWVYRDRGLPDFSVKSTYMSKLMGGAGDENYLCTVSVQNSGNAGAELPVTLSAGERERVTKRLYVPARSFASVRIATVNLPTEVVLNDGSVPESNMQNNSATIAPPAR